MKFWGSALLLVTSLAALPVGPNPAFFQYERKITVPAPDQQNYFVVDSIIWSHARSDLSDLRIYSGNSQVPYMLTAEQNARAMEQHEAKILNLGVVNGGVEFDLDMGGLPEYDRVTLRLKTKNFVAQAQVEGRQELGKGAVSQLGTSTVYDFSRENLGANNLLRFPPATFPYLHIRLGPGIPAKDVLAASIANMRESKAAWMTAGTCGAPKENGRTTIISCELSPGVPVSRIFFNVPPGEVNFRRQVAVLDARGNPVAGGSVSRIRMNRGSTAVDSEDLALTLLGIAGTNSLTIRIDNGDDQPLELSGVVPQVLERRIYFDPHGQSSLRLYYGDEKLAAAVYDYAKFFREDSRAAESKLGPEMANELYTGRADDRPWSERHKSVMWAMMLLAVAVLAVLAVRGMMTGSPSSR